MFSPKMLLEMIGTSSGAKKGIDLKQDHAKKFKNVIFNF